VIAPPRSSVASDPVPAPRVRRRYRIRLAGVLYLAVTLLLGVAAATRPNNLLVWIFGTMLGSILMSGVVSGLMLMRLRMHRLDLRGAAVGEPARLRYAIRNDARFWPAYALSVLELPGTDDANGIRGGAGSDEMPAWVLHVGPGETVHAERWFVPRRRGRFRLEGVRIASAFPFGLLEKSVRIEQATTLLVHPQRHPLRPGVLAALRGDGGGSGRSTPRSGAGEEFFGLREYRPGDSLRQVAWKRLAGLDTLATIERSRTGPPRLQLRLDLLQETARIEASPQGPSPRDLEETAITIVASLAHAAIAEGFEVGLEVLGASLRSETGELEAPPPLPPRGGLWHRERIDSVLAAIDLDAPRRPVGRGGGAAGAARRRLEVVVHPARADRALGGEGSWHFTAAGVERILEVGTTDAPWRRRGQRLVRGSAAAEASP